MDSNDVAVVEERAVPEIPQLDITALIQAASERNADIDTMTRMFDLYERMKAAAAKEIGVRALAAFQAQCPVIKKTKIVRNKDGSERYRYAPIDSIVEQVRDLLKDHGFAYTLDAEDNEKGIKAICTVRHLDGWEWTADFVAPIDHQAYMTAPQKVSSARTYAKRVSFCDALGIMTGDEDDDGNIADVNAQPQQFPSQQSATPAPSPISADEKQAMSEWIDTIGTIVTDAVGLKLMPETAIQATQDIANKQTTATALEQMYERTIARINELKAAKGTQANGLVEAAKEVFDGEVVDQKDPVSVQPSGEAPLVDEDGKEIVF